MSTLTQLRTNILDFSHGLSLDQLTDAIQQHSLSPFCVTDALGRFQAMNHAYAAFYGYLRNELMGQHASILLPKSQHLRFRQSYAQFVQEGENQPQNMQWEVYTKDGLLRTIFVRAVRVVLLGGTVSVVTLVQPEY